MPTATKRALVTVRSIFEARGIKNAVDLSKKTKLSYGVANGAMNGSFSPATRKVIAATLGIPEQELGTPILSDRPGTKQAVPTNGPEQDSGVRKSGTLDDSQTLTDNQKDLLLEALFKSRRASGFTKEEVTLVFAHVEDVNKRFLGVQEERQAVLDALKGERLVNIENGRVTFSIPAPSGAKHTGMALATPLKDLAERYLIEGADKAQWQQYYVNEKRNAIRFWVETLALSAPLDLTLAKFERAVRKLHVEGKTIGTISKYAHAMVAFYDWLAERGIISANPIKGMAAASRIEALEK